LQRTVEKPSKYRLVVKWETVEDHMVHLRNAEEFQEWRKLVGPHFLSPPSAEHMHTAVAGFWAGSRAAPSSRNPVGNAGWRKVLGQLPPPQFV
jgi:hypothetical protein